MSARSRLGKGLSALIQGAEQTTRLGDREVLEVAVTQIEFNARQPRKVFDKGKLRELADSILKVGVLQPVLVRRQTEGGVADNRYRVVAGERRVRAATLAGLATVPAIVCSYEDTEALKIALLENIQREDLGVVEEAEAYQSLLDSYGATQEELAGMLGKSRSGITNALRLLTLDEEVLAMLGAGEISRGHAKVLLGVENAAERISLARMCRNRGLSVRECERLAKQGRKPKPRRSTASGGKKSAAENRAILALQQRAESALGSPVRIDYSERSGKGSVRIRIYSGDDLERILELLGVDTDLS